MIPLPIWYPCLLYYMPTYMICIHIWYPYVYDTHTNMIPIPIWYPYVYDTPTYMIPILIWYPYLYDAHTYTCYLYLSTWPKSRSGQYPMCWIDWNIVFKKPHCKKIVPMRKCKRTSLGRIVTLKVQVKPLISFVALPETETLSRPDYPAWGDDKRGWWGLEAIVVTAAAVLPQHWMMVVVVVAGWNGAGFGTAVECANWKRERKIVTYKR